MYLLVSKLHYIIYIYIIIMIKSDSDEICYNFFYFLFIKDITKILSNKMVFNINNKQFLEHQISPDF